MDRLQRIVGGRPVGILLHGASVKKMEMGIQDVAQGDVCWASLNYFSLVERNILHRIEDRLSLVALFSEQSLPRRYNDILEFLQRKDDNLLITSKFIMDKVPEYRKFIGSYLDKVYVAEGLPVKWEVARKANSVALLLNEIIAAGVGEIDIFGMDGVRPSPTEEQEKESYYIANTIFQYNRYTSIGADTVDFNKAFPKVLGYWKQQGFAPNITNYNPDSHIKVFPRKKWGGHGLRGVLERLGMAACSYLPLEIICS